MTTKRSNHSGFQFVEDKNFFTTLLSGGDAKIFDYKFKNLFDFRDPAIKRKEFNKKGPLLRKELVKRYGLRCMLQIHSRCSTSGKFHVDHVIPLSTNELNKKLRKMEKPKGKKVPAQSFGSNHINNLILACDICNSHKKHRIILPSWFNKHRA